MKIEVTFLSVTDEHRARMSSPGATPHLRVARFHELLEKGVFGENVEVSFKLHRSTLPDDERKVVGVEYTVRADKVGNGTNYFLKHILEDEASK